MDYKTFDILCFTNDLLITLKLSRFLIKILFNYNHFKVLSFLPTLILFINAMKRSRRHQIITRIDIVGSWGHDVEMRVDIVSPRRQEVETRFGIVTSRRHDLNWRFNVIEIRDALGT